MALRYLHIAVPQGTAGSMKLESKFQELLVNMRNTFKGKRISLEFFGINQYTYFYIVMEEGLLETVEGLIYSSFPEAELSETTDYTKLFDASKDALSGADIDLERGDVYPIKMYDAFEEDSLSRLFSTISKIGSDEQVWVQMVAEPQDDTGTYHFKRKWRLKFSDMRQFFRIRDRMRSGGRKSVQSIRGQRAEEKLQLDPYKVSIRCAYIAKDQTTSSRKLQAILSSFTQYNENDVNGFVGKQIANSSAFAARYAQRVHGSARILSVKEVATLYHFPNADAVPHIVHVLARKS